MIRILAYLDDDQTDQLLEIRIEKTGDISGIMHQYICEVAVERGGSVQLFTRQIWHAREKNNILGMLVSLLVGLSDDHFKLDGPLKSRPQPRAGSFFKLARGVQRELRDRQERYPSSWEEG